MTEITIIIQARGNDRWLESILENLNEGPLPKHQIIICQPDTNGELLSLQADYPQLTVYPLAIKSGEKIKSLHLAMLVATGKYVHLIESKDRVNCEYYQDLLMLLQGEDAIAIRSNYYGYQGEEDYSSKMIWRSSFIETYEFEQFSSIFTNEASPSMWEGYSDKIIMSPYPLIKQAIGGPTMSVTIEQILEQNPQTDDFNLIYSYMRKQIMSDIEVPDQAQTSFERWMYMLALLSLIDDDIDTLSEVLNCYQHVKQENVDATLSELFELTQSELVSFQKKVMELARIVENGLIRDQLLVFDQLLKLIALDKEYSRQLIAKIPDPDLGELIIEYQKLLELKNN